MYSKTIGCAIYGSIKISKMALTIIDTPEFQRLRNIKQLGSGSYVFPAATHTRFEHSLGVYHLSQILTTNLQNKYPNLIFDNPELGPTKLTDLVCMSIQLGALCHDIGHISFSHSFDHYLLSSLTPIENASHEVRSCKLVELLCKRELSDELDDKHINFIKSIIEPNPAIHTGALYQIVANHFNNIDLDKFDYLSRDAHSLGFSSDLNSQRIIDNIIIDNNGNLAYAKHCSTEIYSMFHKRYLMHKSVYSHKGSKIIELMINDIIKLVDPIFGISKMIDNINEFCKLTDNTIFFWLDNAMNSSYFLNTQLDELSMNIIKEAYTIYQNIIRRKLYKIIIDTNCVDHLYDFIIYLKNKNISTMCLEIVSTNIGFVSSNNENPFNSIYFYDSKKSNGESFLLNKKQISSFLTDTFMENNNYLICKDRDKYPNILNMYDEYVKS